MAAYAKRGEKEKEISLVLQDSTLVDLGDDLVDNTRFIDPDYFTNLKNRPVELTLIVDEENKKLTYETLDFFDEAMQKKYLEMGLNIVEENQLIRKDTYRFKWFKAKKVIPLIRDGYFPPVDNALANAKKQIWMVMMDSQFYQDRPRFATSTRQGPPSLTNVLLDRLIKAEQRQVDVKLAYDQSNWRLRRGNLDFYEPILAAGGEIYKDSVEITTHAKTIVIDDQQVIIGSTNWTYPALEENNETSVLIESKKINKIYRNFVKDVYSQAEKVISFTE